MKRQILIVLGMAFLPAFAAAAPNLSGSWVKDNAKSDPVPNTMWWLTRDANAGRGGGGGGRGGNAPPAVITIQQDATSLQVTDAQGAIKKYVLDGKAVTRNTETGMGKAVTTASVQGDAVVVGTTQPFGGMPGNSTLEIKEVWSVSPDGNTLTVTTTRTLPAEQKIYKQTYNKK